MREVCGCYNKEIEGQVTEVQCAVKEGWNGLKKVAQFSFLCVARLSPTYDKIYWHVYLLAYSCLLQ